MKTQKSYREQPPLKLYQHLNELKTFKISPLLGTDGGLIDLC